MIHDAIIVGGGPAGASCALWLHLLGFKPLLVEARDRLGGLQNENPYVNSWVAGLEDPTGRVYAARIDAHLRACGVPLLLSANVEAVDLISSGIRVRIAVGRRIETVEARTLVAATGAVVERGGLARADRVYFGPVPEIHELVAGEKVALLGGGDNAFENFGFAEKTGADITIFARTVRARPQLRDRVPSRMIRVGAYRFDPATRTVNGAQYERVFVYYGWRGNAPYLNNLPVVRDVRGYIRSSPVTAETDVSGIYSIGELADRMHPCCATALGDGVVAAKAIERRLSSA